MPKKNIPEPLIWHGDTSILEEGQMLFFTTTTNINGDGRRHCQKLGIL